MELCRFTRGMICGNGKPVLQKECECLKCIYNGNIDLSNTLSEIIRKIEIHSTKIQLFARVNLTLDLMTSEDVLC